MASRSPWTGLFALAVLALGAGRPAPVDAAWYQVELIVFRYVSPSGADGEQWPGNAGEPDIANAMNLIEAIPEFDDEPATDPNDAAGQPKPMAFMRLMSADYRLEEIDKRLSRRSDIEVLTHVAWRQPSFGGSSARTIYISSAAGPIGLPGGGASSTSPILRGTGTGRGVVGTVRFRRARTLNLDVDLLYLRDGPPVRLTATRKMLLHELHYFDHPLFGVIAQITPYVVPDAPDEQEESDDQEEPEEQLESVAPDGE